MTLKKNTTYAILERKGGFSMTHEYAMSRVKDALDKSDGNQLKAQRLLLSWLEKDHTLLFGLVAPHMQGIISHAIAHAVSSSSKKSAGAPAKKVSAKDASEFGAGLLENLRGKAGEVANFGEANPGGISRPGKASKAHVDAINKIIGASKGKGKTKK
jgi:hypothetical protein